MALGGCYSCIKYLMFAFNFIFWLIGCALVGLGIWICVDEMFQKYASFDVLYPAAYVMIAIGVVIMIIGFLGCCGAIRESPCMLVSFFLLLFLIFAALLAFGIWCIVERENLKARVDTQLLHWSNTYYKDEAAKTIMDAIQTSFECCGGSSRTNYPGGKEPKSCPKGFYEEGCSKKFNQWLAGKVIIIAAVAISIAVILVLGMIFSMVLCCAIRGASV